MRQLKVKDYCLMRKVKTYSAVLAMFFLVSCTSNTLYKEPKGLIPQDSMKMLLTDMYLAAGAKNIRDKSHNKTKNFLPLVYEKYKIDSTRFYSSNNYYTSKIELYGEMLSEIKKNLERKQKVYEAEIKVQDSLKKAKKEENRRRIREKDSLKKLKKKKEALLKDSLKLEKLK